MAATATATAAAAVSGRRGVLADAIAPSESDEDKNVGTVLDGDEFEDADQPRCTKAGRELSSLLAKCTESEASTIVRSVTGLDGVETCGKLLRLLQQRNVGEKVRVPRACLYPMAEKDVSQVWVAIMQWEEKRKITMTELGGDAKIQINGKCRHCQTCVSEI